MIKATRHVSARDTDVAISVIVCSRDRAGQLGACLEYLARAAASFHRPWELIIVDNSAHADLDQVLACKPGDENLLLKIIKEPVAGLARARNRGLQNAEGSVIAFTDDDCHVDDQWLENIFDAFEQNGDLALIGGRVDSSAGVNTTMSVRPFGQDRPISALPDIQRYLIGCNFAIRRSTIERVGEFDICLGAGGLARSAEDLDYFFRVLAHEGRMEYVANCRLIHAHERTDSQGLRKLAFNYIYGRGFWYAKQLLKRDTRFLRYLYWELRDSGELKMKLKLLGGFVSGLLAYTFRYRRQLLD